MGLPALVTILSHTQDPEARSVIKLGLLFILSSPYSPARLYEVIRSMTFAFSFSIIIAKSLR
jgi:alpha-D-ribose 1-methylphosphonate 5-triphosphate diphosphatase PhnM